MKPLAHCFLFLPAFVLGIPTSNGPASIIKYRQEGLRISRVAVAAGSKNCPVGPYPAEVQAAGDADSYASASIGLSSWVVAADAANPGGFERELQCKFILDFEGFPEGCTRANIRTSYHGTAHLPREGGMEVKITASHVISAGSQDPNGLPELIVSVADDPSIADGPRPYNKFHDVTIRGERGTNQPNPQYFIDVRAFVTTAGQREGFGRWDLENIDISIRNPAPC